MTLKTEYFSENLPNLYSCASMRIEGKMLCAEHLDETGEPFYKSAGGTYMGHFDNWKRRGEEYNFYDIFSHEKVKAKIVQSLSRAYGSFASVKIKELFLEVTTWALEDAGDDPARIHLIVEWIEELGIVPITAKLVCDQRGRHHSKFAFEVTKAITFNAERGEFIRILKEEHLPQRSRDFTCADYEVRATRLLTPSEARNGAFGRGMHTLCREILLKQWKFDEEVRKKYGIPTL